MKKYTKKVDAVQPVSTTVENVPDPVSVLHDKKNHPVLAYILRTKCQKK